MASADGRSAQTPHDVGLGGRRRPDVEQVGAVRAQALERRVLDVEHHDPAVAPEHTELLQALVGHDERHPTAVEEGEARLAERPVGEADVETELGHRLDARLRRPPIEAPEPAAIAAEPQRTVGRPRRLADRLPDVPAGDHDAADVVGDDEPAWRPMACRGGPTPASTRPGRRVASAGRTTKSVPDDHDLGDGRLVRRQPNDRVDGLGARRVALLDAQDRAAIGREITVGEAQAPRHRRLRCERDGLGARLDPVQPLRRPVGEPQHTVAGPPRAAAVLVHGRAGRSTARPAPRRRLRRRGSGARRCVRPPRAGSPTTTRRRRRTRPAPVFGPSAPRARS